MSDTPVAINCMMQIPEVLGQLSQQITVGRPFLLECKGIEITADFDKKKIDVIIPEAMKYNLHLLKIETLEPGQVVLKMTSYVASEGKNLVFKLSDGNREVDLRLDQIKVESVLTPEQSKLLSEGQEVPPFGFITASLQWPMAITISSLVIVLLFFGGLFYAARKKRQLKKLFDQLKNYRSAIEPDSQIYRSIRKKETFGISIIELEEYFKIYLARKYEIPFVELGQKSSMNYFKKKYPYFKEEYQLIQHRFKDLNELQKMSDSEHVRNYIPKIYHTVDFIEDQFKRRTTVGHI